MRPVASCRVLRAYPQVVTIEAMPGEVGSVQPVSPSRASEWRQLRDVVGTVLGAIEAVRVEPEIAKAIPSPGRRASSGPTQTRQEFRG